MPNRKLDFLCIMTGLGFVLLMSNAMTAVGLFLFIAVEHEFPVNDVRIIVLIHSYFAFKFFLYMQATLLQLGVPY